MLAVDGRDRTGRMDGWMGRVDGLLLLGARKAKDTAKDTHNTLQQRGEYGEKRFGWRSGSGAFRHTATAGYILFA